MEQSSKARGTDVLGFQLGVRYCSTSPRVVVDVIDYCMYRLEVDRGRCSSSITASWWLYPKWLCCSVYVVVGKFVMEVDEQ